MKARKLCLIGIVALLPVTLMADGVLTHTFKEGTVVDLQDKDFQLVEMVHHQSSDIAVSFYGASSPFYYSGF